MAFNLALRNICQHFNLITNLPWLVSPFSAINLIERYSNDYFHVDENGKFAIGCGLLLCLQVSSSDNEIIADKSKEREI